MDGTAVPVNEKGGEGEGMARGHRFFEPLDCFAQVDLFRLIKIPKTIATRSARTENSGSNNSTKNT